MYQRMQQQVVLDHKAFFQNEVHAIDHLSNIDENLYLTDH